MGAGSLGQVPTDRLSTVRLTRSFALPVPPDDAFRVMIDAEQVAAAAPGATLTSWDGTSFTAEVRLRVGLLPVVGNGSGRITARDARARTAVVEVGGRDGTPVAEVTITVGPGDDGSTVTLLAELRTPAGGRFGRSVATEVGNRMVDRTGTALADRLSAGPAVPPAQAPRGLRSMLGDAVVLPAALVLVVARRVLGRAPQ